jgi:hypothetical protein
MLKANLNFSIAGLSLGFLDHPKLIKFFREAGNSNGIFGFSSWNFA